MGKEQKRYKSHAYHEAGHAVMAYIFGDLDAVDIHRTRRRGGQCLSTVRPIETSNRMLIILGGPAAHARGAHTSHLFVFVGPGDRDWRRAKQIAKQDAKKYKAMGGHAAEWTAEKILDPYWQLARRYIRENWPAVEALTAALLTHGKLTGEQAKRIIADALGEPHERPKNPQRKRKG